MDTLLIYLGFALFSFIPLGLFFFIGSTIEKNHLQDLETRERALHDMLVTDLRQFPMREQALTQTTIVTGEAVLAADAPPGPTIPVRNPADLRDVVGQVQEATADDVDQALANRRWTNEDQPIGSAVGQYLDRVLGSALAQGGFHDGGHVTGLGVT